jgi:hypothetical protein
MEEEKDEMEIEKIVGEEKIECAADKEDQEIIPPVNTNQEVTNDDDEEEVLVGRRRSLRKRVRKVLYFEEEEDADEEDDWFTGKDKADQDDDEEDDEEEDSKKKSTKKRKRKTNAKVEKVTKKEKKTISAKKGRKKAVSEEIVIIDIESSAKAEGTAMETEAKKDTKAREQSKKSKPIVKKHVKNSTLHGGNCWVTVKWEGLSYSEVTFESLNDIIKVKIEYEQALRSFYKRETSMPKQESLEGQRKLNIDPTVLSSSVPPSSLPGGELRDYQWDGVRWMLYNLLQGRNSILADVSLID